jgi:enoyl-CoA hydratase/carnithine racemase
MPSESDPVLVEVRDQRMIITLNRPDVLNAQNHAMRVALIEALDRLEADADLRVGILTGAGRAFSAGADIKEMDERRGPGTTEAERQAFQASTMVHFDRVWECDKPLIAAIHGHAVGGGFELAQLCDIRVCSEAAVFGQPEPRNTGGMGGIAVHHLHRIIPAGEANLIHYTGRTITGRRAYEIGLCQKLAADRDGMLADADAIADEIIGCSPTALTRIKRILRTCDDLQVDAARVATRSILATRERGPDDPSPSKFLARKANGA